MFIRKIIVSLVFFTALFTISVNAAQVSQAQIEQFKKLPPAQQQSLAKSMGVDLNAIKGSIGTMATSAETPAAAKIPQSKPREVKAIIIDKKEPNKKLKPFGYDVFANAPSTFSPVMDIAIPSEYILGPGDTISIQMFGKENVDYQLPLTREGEVVVPNLGPFKVAGLSFSEMKRYLTSRIKERIIGVDVVVTISSLRSMRIFVLGDAYKPGPYTLSSLSSITHALFAAGGISNIGSLRKIQLKRSGKLVTTFDLYELLIHGDSSNDLLLQSGDVVFIPSVENRVSISGLVRRPAVYELVNNETFNDVLTMAGGALPSAYLKYTQVKRYSDNSYRKTLDIDLTQANVLQQKVVSGDAIVVKATDYIRAPQVTKIPDAITLTGAVVKPGKYQWQQGQRISDVLPQIETHVALNADLQYSLLVRRIDNARKIEVLQFSLAKALSSTEGLSDEVINENNLLLAPKDQIIIFSHASSVKEAKKEKQLHSSIESVKADNLNEEQVKKLSANSRQKLMLSVIDKLKRQAAAGQPLQLVEVDGEVKYPGIYPLAKNARVKDLVIAAGGVEESAYLARAELTRNQMEGIESRKVSKNIVLSAALKGDDSENVFLQSKDRLNIHKIPSWSKNNVIELKGEFVFPGRYTIRRGETLADVIAKAGGVTEYAHVQGSVFSRTRLKAMEQKNISKLAADLRVEMASKSLTSNNITTPYSDAKSLLEDLSKLEPVGRLVINLERIITDNEYDVLLEGGDVLYVPMKKNSVNVMGQVQVTSSHIYDSNLDAQDYIAQSGGMKIRADEDRVYIIAANGSIKVLADNNWFSSDQTSLNPGDTIVVPLNTEYMDSITLWSTATQIIYNSAVAIAAISGI